MYSSIKLLIQGFKLIHDGDNGCSQQLIQIENLLETFRKHTKTKRPTILYIIIATDLLNPVDLDSGYPFLIDIWNPLVISVFINPNNCDILNLVSRQVKISDVLSEKTDIDKLIDVLKDYVKSNHIRLLKDPIPSSDLPDATVNLDITSLPTEVQAWIQLSQ